MSSFIKKYNLIRESKLISYKQYSNLLRKKGVLTQKRWRLKIINKFYIYLKNTI